jgi:hypothetical protein
MRVLKWTLTHCSIDRQYFTISNAAHCTRLSDLMPNNCKRDIDIHGFAGTGIRQILGSCPHTRAPRQFFDCGDSSRQPATTPEKIATRYQARSNDH